MKSEEALGNLINLLGCNALVNFKQIEIIKQDLDRLEELEKIFSDSHICEIKARFNEIDCSAEKCEDCPLGVGDGICLKNCFEQKWNLQKENQELKSKTIMYDKIVDLRTTPNAIESTLAKYMNKCISLENENQELKEANEVLTDGCIDFASRLEKYQKAIEILKGENGSILLGSDNKHKLYLIDYNLVKYFISKDNYDLLKEVLENE